MSYHYITVSKMDQTKKMIGQIEEACRYNGNNLKDVRSKFITIDLALISVRQNSNAIKYVPKRIIDTAIKSYYYACPYLSRFNESGVINDEIKKAITNMPLYIQKLPDEDTARTLIQIAIKQDTSYLKYVPVNFLDDDLIKSAISDDAMAIIHLPEEYITPELFLDCFNRNKEIVYSLPAKYIKYIPSDLLDMKMCIYYFNEDCHTFKYFPKKYCYFFKCLPEIEERKLLKSEFARYKTISLSFDALTNPYITQEHKKELDIKYDLSAKDITSPSELPEIVPDNNCVNSIELCSTDTQITGSEKTVTDENTLKIYYISDIHIEHQLSEKFSTIAKKSKPEQKRYIVNAIRQKAEEMISDADKEAMLLIGGDVSNCTELSAVFYDYLFENWKGEIISVLGNHELWDGTTQKEWTDPDFTPQSVDEIIDDYRKVMEYHDYRFFISTRSTLLENEIYVYWKNRKFLKLTEEHIVNSSVDELNDILSRCTLVILGGIGFSGLNPVYNSNMGLYRKTISADEDALRTARFRAVYKKIQLCAGDKNVIVLTHMPISDWNDEKCNNNWIYINGHTHQNSRRIVDESAYVLSDGQVGYKPQKWQLKSFDYYRTIYDPLYDPFENYTDGIYEITPEQYKEFNYGRGIGGYCGYEGTLYMLKRNEIYMFILKSPRSLLILNGGKRKGLNKDIKYYYENMVEYSSKIQAYLSPYYSFMRMLSEEVKKIGGDGYIHGCIIDISYFSHIYVNPVDGKATPYWALNTSSRLVYDNVHALIEKHEQELLPLFMHEIENRSLPTISQSLMPDEAERSLAVEPQINYGGQIYSYSSKFRTLQYISDNNVIREWNDNIFHDNAFISEQDKKAIQ